MDKNQALAICFRNLKGTKQKELLLTAQAMRFLRGLPEFSSNRALGHALGVSGEIVRQFLVLLDLPQEVQIRIANGELGLEQGRRLSQLHKARPALVPDTASTITTMTAMATRDLVEFLIRVPTSTIQDALTALEDATPRISHEYHIDAVLDERSYHSLQAQARKRRVTVNNLVSTITIDWLASTDG